jgi:hypothetical protein
MKISQDVKMVFSTIQAIHVAVFVSDYPGYIGVKPLHMILINGRDVVLCPEDKMIQQLTIACHSIRILVNNTTRR